jgi:predicted Zn finger-like uncharacterized protein
MTDSFVTQCPHCQTSFRVSHAQLSVARGMVRCGSCLQVFNAAKQLLEQRAEEIAAQLPQAAPQVIELPAEPAETVAAQQLPVPVKREKAPVDLDSLDLDDLDVELARLEQREIQLPESFGRAGHHAEHEHEQVESFSASRDEPQVSGERWDHGLSDDDVSQLPELRAEVTDQGIDEETDERDEPALLTETTNEDVHHDDDHRTEPSLSMAPVDLDDEPAHGQRLSADSRDDEEHHEPHEHEPRGERFSALDGDDDRRHRDHDDLDDDDTDDRRHNHGKRARSEPALRDQALHDLMDDPLQLSWQKPKPRWGRRMLWLLLVLIALGALVGQYVWYHFDELARQDQYRPWFQELCPQVGCKVPSRVDIKLLKSSNLVVRTHPEFQGALVVDAIIYNRASFSQPFPLLELRFADTGGQLIASRRFKPGEYLSGELAGKDEMPPQTPIHIALDILDPGPKAVNYSLSFRSPE